MQSRRNEEEWKKLVEAASVDVNKAEARSEESRRSAEIKANLATRAMDKLVDQKYTVQANITAFMTHSTYIEMCGMLYNKEITPPFVPQTQRASDVSNVDPEFLAEVPEETPVQDSYLVAMASEDGDFDNFTYVN